MLGVLRDVRQDDEAVELTAGALGVRPPRVVRQHLSNSGKAVYRIELPDQPPAVLRISPRPHTFAFTRRNLDLLRLFKIPVQSVLAAGPTATGGSYVILNWIPGRDLVYELENMSRDQMTRLAEEVFQCQRRVGMLPKARGFGWAPIGRNGQLQTWTGVFAKAVTPSQVEDGTILGGLRARLCRLRGRLESYFAAMEATAFLDEAILKNIIVEDGQLRGIIDLDYICYGDPLLAVGSTMASLAADLPQSAAFYGEELVRLWNPDPMQRLAIWFYAALCATGCLSLMDAATDRNRARSLLGTIQSWLSDAESW